MCIRDRFFTGEALPLFLVTVFSKGERANLSKAECNKLRDITKAIVNEYRARVKTANKVDENEQEGIRQDR